MENTIYVQTESEKYPITLSRGFDGLKDIVKETGLFGRRLCLVTDTNVGKIFAEQIKEILKDCFTEIYIYAFQAGENSKRLETITNFYDFYLDNHFDRKTVVAGLGGGVAGDMAGFSAATYLRGLPFIQIPTSLLAQIDSSVGGKVGVDYRNSKNMIGAFYQPKFVYINTETLLTLPKREFAAGMAETIKYGLILSKEFYAYIEKNKEQIKGMDPSVLAEIIKQGCLFKAQVVSKDEKESGLREILNFGHTIGHSIESLKGFQLVHGECVGIGMVAAMAMSQKRGAVTTEELEAFKSLLAYFDIPIAVEGLTVDAVYEQLFHDKKVRDNKLSFVLLSEIGMCYRTFDLTKEEILHGISYVID